MSCLKHLLKAVIPRRHRPAVRRVYFNVRSFFYVGDRFTCPCCGGHFRKFLTAGLRPRPNAECPRCGSAERHRLLWLYLKNRTRLFSDKIKILHFAPEYIFQRNFRSMSNLEYISTDLDSPSVTFRADITEISCKDETFDAILCTHVLEHVPNDKKAMGELIRILKPGGWAIVQSPVDQNRSKTLEDPSVVSPEKRKLVFGQEDHVRVYGRDYKKRLDEAGFSVKLDWYLHELGQDLIDKHGLSIDEPVYFCTKH